MTETKFYDLKNDIFEQLKQLKMENQQLKKDNFKLTCLNNHVNHKNKQLKMENQHLKTANSKFTFKCAFLQYENQQLKDTFHIILPEIKLPTNGTDFLLGCEQIDSHLVKIKKI